MPIRHLSFSLPDSSCIQWERDGHGTLAERLANVGSSWNRKKDPSNIVDIRLKRLDVPASISSLIHAEKVMSILHAHAQGVCRAVLIVTSSNQVSDADLNSVCEELASALGVTLDQLQSL